MAIEEIPNDVNLGEPALISILIDKINQLVSVVNSLDRVVTDICNANP